MTKVYKIRAKVTTVYSAYVQVPDNWTGDDILDWYEYNGSGGEFTEEDERADWDFGYFDPELTDYDGEPDMVFGEDDRTYDHACDDENCECRSSPLWPDNIRHGCMVAEDKQ